MLRQLLAGTFLLICAIGLAPRQAEAQPLVLPCVASGINCVPVSSINPLPTTGGTITITAGGTATSGFVDGDLISSSGGFTSDSGVLASSLNRTAGQVLFGNGATGPTSDTGLTKVAGATGAITIGGQIIGPVGSAGTPTLLLGNAGVYSTATPTLNFSVNGGTCVSISSTALISACTNGIDLAGGGPFLLWPGGGATQGTLQQGVNAAAPVAQLHQAAGARAGTDTNATGANLTIRSGNGTGTGTPSSLIFQNPAIVASGTGAQTQTAAMTISGTQLVSLPAITADTTHTDATICEDTTTHSLYSGSGTLGICLGTSGRQFKTAFEPMVAGLEEINAIPLWNYRYRPGYADGGARIQFGTTAQDIEAIASLKILVGRDQNGEIINYDMGALLPIALHAIQELDTKKADHNEVMLLRAEIEILKRSK